jgi:CRP-like cAMP-binding protein
MKEETKKRLMDFFSKYPLKKYKKGQVLYEPGDDFGGVMFVKSGYLRVYDISKDGKESSIQLFRPLFYLSLISARTKIKNRHFIEAITPVEVWMAPNKDYIDLMAKNPDFYDEVANGFLEKFVEMTTYMSQLISGDAYSKVASLIHSLAEEFGSVKNKKITIKFKITHKMIASLTGLTRETVTLQMLKLEKDGLIDNYRRQIVVENMKALKKTLGYE